MQSAASRRKRRSSSILKVGGRSPSRNAFQDLNGRDPLDLQEGQGVPLKRDPEPKSRRPSRRVSFADTYQVKEFLTEKDAASLGLWENSQTEDPGQAEDGVFSASVAESTTTAKATISASGLDTLLNGPIKSPAASQDIPVAAPVVCEPPVVSSGEESGTQQTRTFDPEAENTAPLVDSKSFLARLMGGAGSQGNAGSPDLSMSCSSHTFNNTIIFGQDPNITSSLNMTCMDETFAAQDNAILGSDNSVIKAQQQDSKGTIDAGSFLSKFMQQRPALSEDRPISSGDHTVVFGDGDQGNDMDFTVAFSARQEKVSLEKEGAAQRQFGAAKTFVSVEDKTTVFSNVEVGADMDFTTTISSISTSQESVHLQQTFKTEEQDKTTVFSNTHTGADMDFTTTINCISTSQESVHLQQTFKAEEQDKTTVFSNTHTGADMDFTTTISSISTSQESVHLQQTFKTEEQDKTTVFSNTHTGADMDFTTTINCISTSQESVHLQQTFKAEEQDKTTVFSNPNTDADMDFTTTINSMRMEPQTVPTQPPSMAEELTQDKTTVFGEIEAGADMEFTTVIGSEDNGNHVSGQDNSIQPQKLAQDKTVVFNNVECGADMEFTAVIGSDGSRQNIMTDPAKPQKLTQDKTVVFSHVESGAEMELTTAISGNSEQQQHPEITCPPVLQEAAQDRTTVFWDAETGGDMEFTAAVGSLQPDTDDVSSHAPLVQREETNIIGGTEGGMDLTACVSDLQAATNRRGMISPLVSNPQGEFQLAKDSPEKTKILGFNTQDGDMELTTVVPEQKVGDDSQSLAAVLTEGTRALSTQDTGGMELTCQFEPTGNQKKPSKLNRLKRRLSEMAGETTRVFGGEDTAMMELTVGIGTIAEPEVSSRNDMFSTQDRTEAAGGEKTALLDLTVGIGGTLNTQTLSENQDSDKTRVFGSENTARMDLTHGFGGILDGNNMLHSAKSVQKASMPVVQDNCGSSEERSSGMADLPRSTKETTDRTQVFGAEDDGMEMTRCHTGVISEDSSLLVSAKRRKTTAQGKRVSFGPSQTLATASAGLPTMATLDMTERTKIFGSDMTASMDVTSCTGGILGQAAPQGTRETPGRPLSSLADLTSFQQLSKPRSSLPLLRSRTSLVSTARRASAAAASMTDPQQDTDSAPSPQQQETPETVTTAQTVAEEVLEPATTPPSSDSDVAVEEAPQRRTETDIGPPMVENRPPVPPLSIIPVTGDNRGDAGIISPEFDLQNEQLELVETTAEFLAAVCQENLTLPSTKPPAAVPSQYSSSTLPTDLSHANSTLLDVTCRSNSSSDRSALGATGMEVQDDMTLPQQGRLSVSQFLTYCNIVFQDQGKDRRSIMPLIKSDPPETLYDHLEILSSLLPQAHVYEWSCNKLQEHIGSTRQLVKQQEERLDQSNPVLFLEAQKMLQDGRLKEVDQLKKDMESLRSCCKKQAKTEWHQWNYKMSGTIVESLKEEHADMKAGVEELDASLQKIDQSLAALDNVEKDLEDAIINLEGMELPSEEDIQRLKKQQAELLQKEEELAASQQEQEHLKSTCVSLQQEREALELQVDQLQLQQAELGLQQEGEDGPAAQALQEQVRALNRLQGLVEWDLEELSAAQLRVTFLQKSLQLTVVYAGAKDECQKITDIQLESLLADEAAPWAHLCHRMVLGALDLSQLVHTYPTFPTQSKLLHRVSLLVSEARRLGDEVQSIVLRHPFTTVDGTDLTVEFSSVEAHAKFFVTFNLTPGAYPNQLVKCTCTHRIGAISPSAVEGALCGVPAGSLYLTRMVQSVEELIQQHADSLRQTRKDL
ncbi:serine-rich adhesin for platelets-like isoform X3 [Branchiostoma floridae]|uniref:Serine-rich adhesin for platelets-like isoform X3 n=1 Tax=Branchiostoma floridae TaxID=7739 RepID=A0A9J7L9Q2_BRAFL|nr:serine-rich adhesin for platelets-like isoform X3 [Branchiostoma floridae]